MKAFKCRPTLYGLKNLKSYFISRGFNLSSCVVSQTELLIHKDLPGPIIVTENTPVSLDLEIHEFGPNRIAPNLALVDTESGIALHFLRDDCFCTIGVGIDKKKEQHVRFLHFVEDNVSEIINISETKLDASKNAATVIN